MMAFRTVPTSTSHPPKPAHSSTSYATTCSFSNTRFASVDGSSLEEKLSFLAEQRERENSRCEAFAREVEEAMEREASATFGGNHCGYHSAASPALPHLTSPYHSDFSDPTSLPSESCASGLRPSPSHGEVPAPSHLCHVRKGSVPELGGQKRMTVDRAAVRRTQSVADMAAAPACQWFVDLSYYESASPASVHRHTSGRRTRRDALGTMVHSRTSRRVVTGELTEQLPRNRRVHSI